MLASDVISACSTDLRSTLSNSGNDAAIILGWVDRIQKDILHTSFWSHLNQFVTTVSTTAGTSAYVLSPGTIRRIVQVFDRTGNRDLLPANLISIPFNSGQSTEQTPVPAQEALPTILNIKNLGLYPKFYRYTGSTNTLYIFPAPSTATYTGTLEVYYEGQIATVSSTGATLTLPDDAKDVMVAGVMFLASQFLKLEPEATQWQQHYEKLKKGEQNL